MAGRRIFKLKPLYDVIIVRPITNESKTSSGLVIPEVVQDDTLRGVVVAIGDDARSVHVSVDDVVIFNKNYGYTIYVDGERYVIVRMGDILAVENNHDVIV